MHDLRQDQEEADERTHYDLPTVKAGHAVLQPSTADSTEVLVAAVDLLNRVRAMATEQMHDISVELERRRSE